MTSYVYLHGFASSPASLKAQYFKSRLAERGVVLEIPALDGGDFEHLTLSGQLARIEELWNDRETVLLGSSMGGYLAAIYASKHPEVERLVLLAPAFDFSRRWAEAIGEAAMARWKSTGQTNVFHYGEGRKRAMGYELYTDALQYPAYPAVPQPVMVLHGERDTVVPVDRAREFQKRQSQAILKTFDSGHELSDVLPDLWLAAEGFLFHHHDGS